MIERPPARATGVDPTLDPSPFQAPPHSDDWPDEALSPAVDGRPAEAAGGPDAGAPVGLDGLLRLVPVERLAPNPRNARTHSPEQVDRLASLICHYGFTNPAIADLSTGELLAGHGRRMALVKLWSDPDQEVRLPGGGVLPRGMMPVIDATGWDEGKRRAYMLAHNAIALDAGWDDALLREELFALKGMDVALELTGFDDLNIVQFMARGGVTHEDPDAIPEAPEVPVSRPGDIWVLGAHRIICGDSTDAETVKALLGEERPHLMVTDPPYGVEYDPKWRLRAGINKPHQDHAYGVVSNDDRADWTEAWRLFPGDVAYVWHGGLHAMTVGTSLATAGFAIRSQIIWAKPSLLISRGHYHWQHEPCFYAVREGATGHWNGDRKQSTLWQIANMHRTQGNTDDGKNDHSTQKPVECMRRPIENNSKPGDAVYEPFSGSGTTIIAAEMTRRRCFAIELNPVYVDMAVDRWQRYTGQRATRLEDGVAFSDLKAA